MTGLIIIIIPLLIYVIGAFSVAQKDLTHPDNFFIAYRKVGVTAFSSSSIAYAFQMSTVYPFLLWGALNFYFVPLVNTICWGLGILLFYLSFNRYKQFIGEELTLHGFLGKTYGPSVRVVASYLTIIAFLGCAIAETYFGSKALLSIVDNKGSVYLMITFALLFVFVYIAYGGQVSSIRTDQLQLIISYIGVFGLLLYFIYLIISTGISISPLLSWSFLILFIYIIIVLLSRKLKFIKFSETDSKSNKFINKSLNLLVVTVLGLVAILSFIAFLTNKQVVTEFKFFNLEGFGVAGLLSLVILPLCFQFIDLSNWQRLLSVKPETTSDSRSLYKNIRKGLLTYAVESPFTWLIFLFFGSLIMSALPNFTFKDLLIDIPKQLINSNMLIQRILGYTFIVSVLAIMLSTVDSFIMGVIFTFVYDSHPKTRKLLDSKNIIEIKNNYSNITNIGRIFGLIAIICGILFFIVFDVKVPNGGVLFINLLLAFYAAQLAFFPHVFGILFLKNHPTQFWASVSMIVGALCGVSIGIYAVIAKPEWAWYPILICFGLSSFIYLLGYTLKRNNFGQNLLNICKKFLTYCKQIIIYCKNILTDYRDSKFSYVIWIIIFLSIILGSAYYISFKKDITNGIRIWELCSYVGTFAYTFWFWYCSKNGRTIIVNISKKDPLRGFYVVGTSLSLLFLIMAFHLRLTRCYNFRFQFFPNFIKLSEWIGNNAVSITLSLLICTYLVFSYISKQIRKNASDSDMIEEFQKTYKYLDRTVAYIFCILLFYSIYLGYTGFLKNREIFFSGAIAFDLLLSSFIWIQTKVA